MNTEIHTMFQPLIASTGAQNSSTVTSESGIAAYCIKGMRLPRLLVLRSDRDAINGSVTASNTRDSAVIKPSTVKKPPMTRPGTINCTAPLLMSFCVGR